MSQNSMSGLTCINQSAGFVAFKVFDVNINKTKINFFQSVYLHSSIYTSGKDKVEA